MKKESFDLKLNNKGSSMVFAIVAILFVMLLASTTIALAMGNLALKRVEMQSKRSFYTAESVMDEIYTGLGKLSLQNMNDAYVQELSQLVDDAGSMKNNSAANAHMKNQFIALCFSDLTGGGIFTSAYTGNAYNQKIVTILNSYITNSSKASVKSVSQIKAFADDANGYTIRLKDVVVNYESEEGYFSDITTDFVIRYPNLEVSFRNEQAKDFLEYCLIADKNVVFGRSDITVNAGIRGGLYAGENLNIHGGSTVNMQGESGDKPAKMVAHGEIQISGNTANKAELQIGNATLWTEGDILLGDVLSGQGGSIKTGTSSVLYVQDDLQFNTENCDADIQGEYYGYGASREVNGMSASILINARSGRLNVAAKVLQLLGYASVDVDQAYGHSYETGESISVKNAQEIYLVLDEYLQGVTNPIAIGSIPADYMTLIDQNKLKNDFFAYHLLANIPVKLVMDEHRGMAYFYYDFKDDASREKYAKAVSTGEIDGKTVQNNRSWMTENGIWKESGNGSTNITVSAENNKILGNSVQIVGNSVTLLSGSSIRNAKAESDMIRAKLRGKELFGSMASYGIRRSVSAFDSIINTQELKKLDEAGYHQTYIDEAGNNWELRVAKRQNTGDSYTVEDRRGILIYAGAGTVIVPENFTGLIITKEAIFISENITISCDSAMVEMILEDTPQFSRFFQAYYTPADENTKEIGNLDYDDFIHMENWRKFEDSNMESASWEVVYEEK